jgi:hypothetical protein
MPLPVYADTLVFGGCFEERFSEASAKVVGPACENDAPHIGVATIASVDASVSWNFKHIVSYEKMIGYERINSRHGYRTPRYSPYEGVSL